MFILFTKYLHNLNKLFLNILSQWPFMVILVAMQICLPVALFYSGPISLVIAQQIQEACQQNWYKPLLFISNFDQINQMVIKLRKMINFASSHNNVSFYF